MCDKCEAEIGVMIDIITKYPDISPHTQHAISRISRPENIISLEIIQSVLYKIEQTHYHHLSEFFRKMNVK